MTDRICQDEPGRDAHRLTRWFAERVDAREDLRRALAYDAINRKPKAAAAAVVGPGPELHLVPIETIDFFEERQ